MAKKSSNKMASRQARLNQKRRKSIPNVFKGPNELNTDNNETDTDIEKSKPVGTLEKQSLTTHAKANPQLIHKKERLSNSAMSVYSYVGSEVKRIGIIGGIILHKHFNSSTTTYACNSFP